MRILTTFLLVSTGLLLALFTVAMAGEVTKSSYDGYEWKSTRCYEPNKPSLFGSDERKIQALEDYTRQVKQYVSCISDEARRDLNEEQRKLAEGIEKGRNAAIREVQRDLEELSSSLSQP